MGKARLLSGLVYDGSGDAPFSGDVYLQDGLISGIEGRAATEAGEVFASRDTGTGWNRHSIDACETPDAGAAR